jgi:thiol-disulfide isomerase/thioredoxin
LIETKYPHPFQIGYLDTLSGAVTYSHYFFVGNSKVKINLEDLFKEKDVLRGKLSKENKEYSKLQDIYKAYVNRQTGEVYNLSGKLEVIRLYILENPESFVALWDLVLNYNWIKSEGDRRRVLTVIQNFSSSIQNTKTFRALSNKIVNDLQLAEGGRMPNIIFDGNDTLLSVVSKNRYTLVDFWFTSCQPCLNQFGKFKSIYEKNRHKGFEIIGVSIDDKERTFQLQEVIRKFDLSWVQFRDPGGVEASRLFIVGYPANFLLDKDGKIVKKDISPEDLGKYLENELLKF